MKYNHFTFNLVSSQSSLFLQIFFGSFNDVKDFQSNIKIEDQKLFEYVEVDD